MSTALKMLVITAVSVGFVHTLIGPDHYVPFIALAKARRWSLRRTMSVTFLCGLGHVSSSVILGLTGMALGVGVARLETVESMRANVGAWVLLAFGLGYTVWGLVRAWKDGSHRHFHDRDAHVHRRHDYAHVGEQAHESEHSLGKEITPWVLFIIFFLGPCEPLIPIVMYPAATMNLWGLAMVTAAFGIATIGTMLVMVVALTLGISIMPFRGLVRYGHALAGASILAAGILIKLGL